MINNFKLPEYSFLSNFHLCKVEYNGLKFPSLEHAYVFAKLGCPEDLYNEILSKTSGQVKRLGRKHPSTYNWDLIKILVMEELLRSKFSSDDLSQKLLATGEQELIEGNNWNDTFWGVCKGVGENHLGKLLMKIRKELKQT